MKDGIRLLQNEERNVPRQIELPGYNSPCKIGKENDRWLLLDLDGLLSTREDISIFTRDGFHLSKRGLALVASIESEFIARHILHKRLEIDNASNSINKH